jgi:hypothetical protein
MSLNFGRPKDVLALNILGRHLLRSAIAIGWAGVSRRKDRAKARPYVIHVVIHAPIHDVVHPIIQNFVHYLIDLDHKLLSRT